MADAFDGYTSGLDSPGDLHVSITPSDSTDIANRPRALRFNGAGDVVIRDRAGTDITYTVTAGEVMPFRGVRILSTGTTATGIVGWW